MTTLPLVAHLSPDSIIAWRSRNPDAVTLQQFLADVNQLVSLLPAGNHMLNMCSDRYHFSVGLAAAIVANKISLLPSTHTPEVIRQIKAFAPDVFCLSDNENCNVDLPQLAFPETSENNDESFATPEITIPKINGEQCVAIVFTSGSTGAPKPHPKTWAALVSSIQAQALRIGLKDHSATTLISTVPPQHMYGLESSVLIAWFTGNALCDAQPFYPADVCQTLSNVPSPRVLVSSPVHLRTLLDADLIIPKVDLVISATAPLANELAQKVEARCDAPLFEIYGSTETGLIATRRSSQTEQWQLLPEIHLIIQGEKVYAMGGHIKTPTIMNDVFDAITETHFLLRGRVDDMINIAGRRHSLASLNHILNTIPGVIDGAFYMPDESDDNNATTRLAACVVAPELNATQLLILLRDYIAPVFLPRPLLFVDKLPRNETGKLSRASLHDLFQSNHLGKSHE